ncbi:MAG: hypothetical protein ACREMU_04390 [Gemmatimonadaceae bacterium]
MLRLVRMMNTKQTAAITDIEDAATVRWLARALAPARADARRSPTDEAIDRMRARVFGAQERPKHRQRIAA